MKRRLTDRRLRRWYRLLSVRMTEFDCGTLCAPDNDGSPYCCDRGQVVPVLYRDELCWHRRRSRFWRRSKPRTPEEKKLAAEIIDDVVLADCPGVAGCRRSLRALVCRTFPFEPHLDEDGRLFGITYQYSVEAECPLVGRPRRTYNAAYIRNALIFWNEALDVFPEEREMYIAESRKLRRRFRKQGRRIRVFS